jgi:hypothetical protein
MTIASSTAAVLAIALGGLICFFGYRLLRVTLGIVGFGVGFALGGMVASLISNITPVFLLIIAVASGVLGAILAAVLYKAGVFLLGAGAGALIASLALAGAGNTQSVLIAIAAAIVGGVLTLLLQRTLVSVLTAFGGAWGGVAGVFHLVGWYDLSADPATLATVRSDGSHFWIIVGCWLVLGTLGSAAQLSAKRKKK